jgi:hypothetical protein
LDAIAGGGEVVREKRFTIVSIHAASSWSSRRPTTGRSSATSGCSCLAARSGRAWPDRIPASHLGDAESLAPIVITGSTRRITYVVTGGV